VGFSNKIVDAHLIRIRCSTSKQVLLWQAEGQGERVMPNVCGKTISAAFVTVTAPENWGKGTTSFRMKMARTFVFFCQFVQVSEENAVTARR